jgi:hypothetical protein
MINAGVEHAEEEGGQYIRPEKESDCLFDSNRDGGQFASAIRPLSIHDCVILAQLECGTWIFVVGDDERVDSDGDEERVWVPAVPNAAVHADERAYACAWRGSGGDTSWSGAILG